MNLEDCGECCLQFSLPKASTGNPHDGFFQTVEAFFLSNIDPLNKKFLKDAYYEG